MEKYIDAEKLKELIDKRWKELADKNVKVGGSKWDAEISTYLSVLALIDSLQQEMWRPNEEQMEVLSDAYAEASTLKNGDILESLYNDLIKL